MNKPKRKKIQREQLEGQLFKYERRIQRLAQEAYYIRKALELMDAQEAARNKEKGIDTSKEVVEAAVQTKVEEKADAICGNSTGAGFGDTEDNAGEDRGFVRPILQADGQPMVDEPELDNVERDSQVSS